MVRFVNACFLPTYRLAVATTRLCDRCWQPSARSTLGWQVSVGVRTRIRDRKTGGRRQGLTRTGHHYAWGPTELRASAAPGRCRSSWNDRENPSQERRGIREPPPASANPDSIRFL